MKKNLRIGTIISLLALFVISACAPDINEPNDTLPSAQVRFIHAASTAEELDFAVMNTVGATLLYVQRETRYGRQYRYDFFKTGEREFRLLPSRTTLNIARTVTTLEANKKFTAFAIDAGNSTDTLLLIAQDTLATPSDSKAFVRFIHASSDAGAISITGEISQFKTLSGAAFHLTSPLMQESKLSPFNFQITPRSMCHKPFSRKAFSRSSFQASATQAVAKCR